MFVGSYCGSPPTLAEIASRWNFDPVLVALLAGALALALRAGNKRAAGGIGLLAIAFISPLCAASVALFSARSIHHLLLMLAGLALALAVRQTGVLGRAGRVITPIAPATILMTVTLWLWHVPALYQAGLSNMLVYWLMQATILGTSFAFWLAIRRSNAIGAMGGLVGGMVQMGFLGALLTFAPQPLYLPHAVAAPAWGLTGLADQQLAGLIMWVGGMAPFALGGAVIAWRAWQRQNTDLNRSAAAARAV